MVTTKTGRTGMVVTKGVPVLQKNKTILLQRETGYVLQKFLMHLVSFVPIDEMK